MWFIPETTIKDFSRRKLDSRRLKLNSFPKKILLTNHFSEWLRSLMRLQTIKLEEYDDTFH